SFSVLRVRGLGLCRPCDLGPTAEGLPELTPEAGAALAGLEEGRARGRPGPQHSSSHPGRWGLRGRTPGVSGAGPRPAAASPASDVQASGSLPGWAPSPPLLQAPLRGLALGPEAPGGAESRVPWSRPAGPARLFGVCVPVRSCPARGQLGAAHGPSPDHLSAQILPGLILSDIRAAKRMKFKTVCYLLVQLMQCWKMFKAEILFSNDMTCEDDDKCSPGA
uniref:Uncharacterized protein n=1 Tax=Canis lupus dingo TaxID=286419 RepID=A0A8C0K1E8_CANLU